MQAQQKQKCGECMVQDKELLRCARCKAVYYCNVDCQKKHFPTHKLTCSKPKQQIIQIKENEQAKLEGINEFQNMKCIGNGNFSVIFQARSKKNGEKYAIKQVQKMRLKQLRKEEDIFMQKHCLSKLKQCPYVVKLHRTFQDELYLFLQMQCPEGGQLWEVGKNFGILNEQLYLYYVSHIVKGLLDLHEKYDIIHRDIKPENILLTNNHQIKFIDFGTAKDLSRPDLKGSGNGLKGKEPFYHYVGTPNYMAPECIHNKASEKISDVYSLGGLFYFLKVGSPPFAGGSEYLIFKKSLQRQIFLPQQLFSKDLRDLIMRTNKKNIQQRITLLEIVKHNYFKNVDFEKLPSFTQIMNKETKFQNQWNVQCKKINLCLKDSHKKNQQQKIFLFNSQIKPIISQMETNFLKVFPQEKIQEKMFIMKLQIQAVLNLKNDTNLGFQQLYKLAKGIQLTKQAQILLPQKSDQKNEQ